MVPLVLRRLAVTGLVVSISACSGESITPPEPSALPSTSVESARPVLSEGAQRELMLAAQGRTRRGMEDEILRMESRIPTLGGLYRDENDRAVIYLLDVTHGPAAIAELRAIAPSLNVEPGLRSQLTRGANVVVRQGHATFSQLLDWKRTVGAAVGSLDGFSSIDADESVNRIRVTVDPDGATDEFERAVARLNLPDSIVMVVTVPVAQDLASIRDRFRPTEGGMQIQQMLGKWCTIGFNVTTYGWGETGFLTASHCDPGVVGTGATGSIFAQPTYISSNYVGTVLLNPAWNRTDPDCLGHSKCTDADVMFVKYTNAFDASKRVSTTNGVGTSYGGGSISRIGYWSFIGIPPFAYVGMTMDKVGRTTGWTRGTLSQTCVDKLTTSGMKLCSNAVTGSRVGKGDSGAPVFYPLVNPDPLYTMGILFAGDGINVSDPQGDYCNSGCTYYYSPWESLTPHLGRYFQP